MQQKLSGGGIFFSMSFVFLILISSQKARVTKRIKLCSSSAFSVELGRVGGSSRDILFLW